MIAPNEDVTAAGSGETAPTTITAGGFEPLPTTITAPDAPATPTPTTAPADPTTAPSKPRWATDQKLDGTTFPPASYAQRFGETAEGLVQWAELNQTHLGIPGEYNAAVLLQAAGRLTELTLALGMIKAVRPALLAVYNGESLHNEAVREAFRKGMDVIDDETAEFVAVPFDESEAPAPVPGWDKIETTTETATPATPAA